MIAISVSTSSNTRRGYSSEELHASRSIAAASGAPSRALAPAPNPIGRPQLSLSDLEACADGGSCAKSLSPQSAKHDRSMPGRRASLAREAEFPCRNRSGHGPRGPKVVMKDRNALGGRGAARVEAEITPPISFTPSAPWRSSSAQSLGNGAMPARKPPWRGAARTDVDRR